MSSIHDWASCQTADEREIVVQSRTDYNFIHVHVHVTHHNVYFMGSCTLQGISLLHWPDKDKAGQNTLDSNTFQRRVWPTKWSFWERC